MFVNIARPLKPQLLQHYIAKGIDTFHALSDSSADKMKRAVPTFLELGTPKKMVDERQTSLGREQIVLMAWYAVESKPRAMQYIDLTAQSSFSLDGPVSELDVSTLYSQATHVKTCISRGVSAASLWTSPHSLSIDIVIAWLNAWSPT